VHLGHQYLIKRLLEVSKTKKFKSILVTISQPIRPVPGVLTTEYEKLQVLNKYPLDEIIVLPNTNEITNLSALSFLEDFLCKKLNARHIIAGENFAFGRDREGNIHWLKEQAKAKGIEIEILKPYKQSGFAVSSTRIRDFLLSGHLKEANKLLSRFYCFEGMQEKGRGLGTKLGFPTVNLKVEEEKLLPPGVYAGLIELDKVKKYQILPCVINIGTRPTFFNKGKIHCEVHILDFNSKWPNKKTRITLLKYLRPEKRFENVERLKQQINTDITEAEKHFKPE
jgi:riboflavin kinase/FMN adenylyltransferase